MADGPRGQHTLPEILSQPRVWQATLDQLTDLPASELPDLRSYDRIAFTGCGSTHYLAQWAARQCQQLLGVPALAAPASELWLAPAAWMTLNGGRALLVAISRSGDTSETLRAVETFAADGHGECLAITCYPDRQLAQMCRWRVPTPAGQEHSIAQTRSYTSMMLAVARLLDRQPPPDLVSSLSGSVARLIEDNISAASAWGGDLSLERFFFLGSGPLYGLACEAMLKMKEMSLSHSEAYHCLEFRHGPMSMVDERSAIVCLLSEAGFDQEVKVLRDMKALGGRVLALVERAMPPLPTLADGVVELGSGLPPLWRAPLYLPILQLLACHRALAKGLDPDRPAHLSAVVTLDE